MHKHTNAYMYIHTNVYTHIRNLLRVEVAVTQITSYMYVCHARLLPDIYKLIRIQLYIRYGRKIYTLSYILYYRYTYIHTPCMYLNTHTQMNCLRKLQLCSNTSAQALHSMVRLEAHTCTIPLPVARQLRYSIEGNKDRVTVTKVAHCHRQEAHAQRILATQERIPLTECSYFTLLTT